MPTDLPSNMNTSDPPRSRPNGRKSRHVATLSNLPLLGRTALLSRIQQVATETPRDAKYPALLAFFQFWKWLLPYLRDWVHEDAPYQTYPDGTAGIFPIAAPPGSDPLKIAVAADWGTGTYEAETVAEHMKACLPHHTVHLGDVYYMGEDGEVGENCLGERARSYTGVKWPKGSLGSFALMGNHEMYSGGQGYFERFLTELGLLNPDESVKVPQRASFFCLEAEYWVIFGLDTGYHSGGIPIFTSIPGMNSIPFLNVDARFDDKMLDWMKQTTDILRPRESGRKSVVILTHHQPISSFEHAFDKPAEQLANLGFLDGQEFVWLYGHEHRLTVYDKHTIAGGLQMYPRCIGHGGMPVEVTKLSGTDSRILYYDPRQHPIDKDHPDTKVGYNGYVLLILEGAHLTIEYRDILNNAVLLTETFTPDGLGRLQHSVSKPPDSPLLSGQQTS